LFQIQPKLRPLVPLAVERAIREIVNPVAERSVTISCLTTREIVLKDLCLEADENALRKAAQLMVGTLAGSLALVTCREPFRAALTNNLKGMLSPGGVAVDANEQALVEQVVQVVTAENLDLGCVIVERAVYERAVREINETISVAIQARRLHREQQAILSSSSGGLYTPSTFVDPTYDNVWTQQVRQRTDAIALAAAANIYKEFREGIVRMESSLSTPIPPAIGPHPAIVTAQGLALPGVAPRPMPPPPPVGLPPPPPPASPPAAAPGLPSLQQLQQLRAAVRTQAELHEGTAELRELTALVTRGMEELARKLASVESLMTLPEIVENQPFQLDPYYGLISLGFNAEWLEYLRRVQMLLARDPTLALPAVWAITKTLTERFEMLVGQVVPLTLPPPLKNVPPYLATGEPNPEAIAERAQARAVSVGSSVTQEHLFVELAFAALALVPSVLPDSEALSRSLHTPVMAWLMELLFTQLTETASDSVRSALLTVILGALRYSLVKEGEMDRMLARLLTEHRTIGTTGFVVHLLQVFTCRMRMSPLQHWPITTEVIYKMLQRVTAAGPLIPPSEKTLALQLDSFSKEMKAVANVSAERIAAYRQLHCLATRPPEPLPWDIVANQAMLVTKIKAPTGQLFQVSEERRRIFGQLLSEVVSAKIQEFKHMPPALIASIWVGIRAAGCELDMPVPPGPMQPAMPEWTDQFFQTVMEKAVEGFTVQNGLKAAMGSPESVSYEVVDGAIALMLVVCNRGDVPPLEPRPLDILRCKYIKKMWETASNVLVAHGQAQKLFARIFALTLQDALSLRRESGAFVNAVLSHYAKTLASICPQNVPLFTFGWIDLLANRFFLPSVLGFKGQRGWPCFERLLVEALSFVSAAIDQVGQSVIPDSLRILIQGIERLLLIINQDFPEFLVKACDGLLIHLSSGHMARARNIVLAAVPKTIRLVDPFTATVQLELLGPGPEVPAKQLRAKLEESKYEPSILNGVLNLAGRQPQPLETLKELIQSGDKNKIIEGIVNMLRLPGPRTSLFSVGLLFVFVESGPEVKELIVKTIVQRLVMERPHPWGLLATFAELVKNPRFGLWKQSFVKDETESLLRKLAVLCLPAPEGPSSLLQQIVEQQRAK